MEERILLIYDQAFGEKLREATPSSPIWIVASPANNPYIAEAWSQGHADHLVGVTKLNHDPASRAEDHFLDDLSTIDLHHGPYSTDTPYTALEVLGLRMTDQFRQALSQLGFDQINETDTGFHAKRNDRAAREFRL